MTRNEKSINIRIASTHARESPVGSSIQANVPAIADRVNRGRMRLVSVSRLRKQFFRPFHGRQVMNLNIRSGAFASGEAIPRRHTGDGEDLSPALSWSSIPAAAREFALIVDDPDMRPRLSHGSIGSSITLRRRPMALQREFRRCRGRISLPWRFKVRTDGTQSAIVPRPPKGHGIHRYFFKLYALDKELDLPPGLDKPSLLKRMQGHIVDEGELMGTYQRWNHDRGQPDVPDKRAHRGPDPHDAIAFEPPNVPACRHRLSRTFRGCSGGATRPFPPSNWSAIAGA